MPKIEYQFCEFQVVPIAIEITCDCENFTISQYLDTIRGLIDEMEGEIETYSLQEFVAKGHGTSKA